MCPAGQVGGGGLARDPTPLVAVLGLGLVVQATIRQSRLRRSMAARVVVDYPGEARLAVFRWATRYNTRRRHSSIGQISPNAFGQRSVTLTTAA